MICVAYQRTMAGAALRLAERRRTLSMELPAPNGQHKPVVAPEPPHAEPVHVILGDVVIAMPTRYREHRRVIDLVARMHGVSYAAVMGSRRFRKIVPARMAAMCAVKEWENQHGRELSLPHVGRIFGRDHTTVLNSFRKRGYQEMAR